MRKKTIAKKVAKWQYLGETDPAHYIWSNKTHRTASEAFRDADYATPIWRCETDWDRAKEYFKWGVMWIVVFYSLYALASWFELVVS